MLSLGDGTGDCRIGKAVHLKSSKGRGIFQESEVE